MAVLVQVLGRGLLAGTFFLAGAAKLASPAAAAEAVQAFGAPRVLQPLLRWLPHLEIAVALALAFAPTAWYAAWGAGALLVIFLAAIAANLARGRRPDCNCFGQIRPAPISGRTLIRNGALLAVAVGLVAGGPPPPHLDLLAWVLTLSTGGQVRLALVAGALLVALRFWLAGDTKPGDDDVATPATVAAAASPAAPPRRRGPTPHTGPRLTGNGLAEGTPAPAFTLPDLAGTPHSLDSLLEPGLPVVLVFSSPGCESCQALVPRLPAQAAEHRDRARIVLVSRDTVARNRAKLPDPGNLPVLLQRDYEVAEAFDITSSPASQVVAPDGRIAGSLAMGGQAVLAQIASAVAPPPPVDPTS